MISINYRDARPIHEQIRSGFVRLIATGVIEPDEKLPSVRELAAQLAINPNTIQKAYAWLEAEGYVYTIVGRGSFASQGNFATNRRKAELMEELDEIVRQMCEMSVVKEEIIEQIEHVFLKDKGERG